MQPVHNSLGEDITAVLRDAARQHHLDPIHLLALLKAESGLTPQAERWGGRTNEARDLLIDESHSALQALIDDVWPDISFGYGQQIVLYHYFGDRTQTVDNVLAVRARVFEDPDENLYDAARRLAVCQMAGSYDGTPLSAMVIYNAGSDRRSDPDWMQRWAGNVAAYERALQWAEDYREDEIMDRTVVGNVADVLNGWLVLMEAARGEQTVFNPEMLRQLRDCVVALRRELEA